MVGMGRQIEGKSSEHLRPQLEHHVILRRKEPGKGRRDKVSERMLPGQIGVKRGGPNPTSRSCLLNPNHHLIPGQ